MNKKKLISLVAGLVILIVSSGIASFLVLTFGNKNLSEEKIRVACVGDSITEGTGYPDDLWMLLGNNYTIGNFGVGGSAVSINSSRPYIDERAFQKAKEFLPNIVIIMLGTNDASPTIEKNGSFVDDYVKLITEFQALSSKPRIWIVKPPPVFSNETGLSPRHFIDYVIPNIERVADKTDLPIIDVYSALANYSDLFLDGVHPNSEGALLIAIAIQKAIT